MITHLNPDALHKNPAFTQVIVVDQPAKTVYIGGLNAVNAAGEIVGKGDFKEQTRQVFKNMQAALAAAGASVEHVVKWNIYVVQGQSIQDGFQVSQEVLGTIPKPPTITVLVVAGLGNPDFLLEMDAIAVIPQ